MKTKSTVVLMTGLFFTVTSLVGAHGYKVKSGTVSHYSKTKKRSTGCANNGLGDRTGSPASSGTCANCHSGGSFASTLQIVVKDGGGNAVTEYLPGTNYTVEFIMNGSGATYAFQGVAYTSTNQQAGAFGTPTSPNTQVVTSGGVEFAEHSSPAAGAVGFTFSLPWTAPMSGTGNVTFYGMGINSNANGGTSGDDATSAESYALTEAVPTIINYASSNYCSNDGTVSPSFTGTTGGTYSSTTGLDIDPTSGEVNPGQSTPGTYTVTYTYSGGSTTDDITINATSTSTDTQVACDTYTWIDGSTYTASTNTPTLTLTNAVGCDSIVTLDLTINSSSSFTDVQTACGSYTWIDGNTYTASTSTPTFTLTNAVGCDSIVSLDLTINAADVSVTDNSPTLEANATGATYQWIDCSDNSVLAGETNQIFIAAANGNYAVIVTENGCSDTSTCFVVDNLSLDDLSLADFSIYPNPSDGQFTVKHTNMDGLLFVFDAQGREQFRTTLEGEITELDLNLPSGVYTIQINTTKKQLVIH